MLAGNSFGAPANGETKGKEFAGGGFGRINGFVHGVCGKCPLVSAASTGFVTKQRVARCSNSLVRKAESVFPRPVSNRVISDAH